MGTGFEVNLSQLEVGIIPRAVHQLFAGIQSRREHAQETGTQPPEFKVTAQFLEVSDTSVYVYSTGARLRTLISCVISRFNTCYSNALLQRYRLLCVCGRTAPPLPAYVHVCDGRSSGVSRVNVKQMGRNREDERIGPLFHKQEVTPR